MRQWIGSPFVDKLEMAPEEILLWHWRPNTTSQQLELASAAYTPRRSRITSKSSAITAPVAFGPRFPLPWTRTLTALASMSRFPMTNIWTRTLTALASRSRFPITSMVWTFICSAAEILALMWSLLASSSARTSWARSSVWMRAGVFEERRFIADGQDADLFRGEPEREVAGVMLDQEADETLVRA